VTESPVDRQAIRTIATSRPELAALLLVVALFLAFETVAGWKIVDAVDRNTAATNELTGFLRATAAALTSPK
jgi:hypothetical protein